MTTIVGFLVTLSVVSFLLYVASLVADRNFASDVLVNWLFHISAAGLLFLLSWGYILVEATVINDAETRAAFQALGGRDPSFTEFVHIVAGGWARLYAVICFATTVTGLIAAFLGSFVEAVDEQVFYVVALISFLVGLIVFLGFTVFFEGVALILGIAATAIGIMVGLKKLKTG